MPIQPTPQLENYFLHYTSRSAAQSIILERHLTPGRSGRIFLTRDLYTFGTDASDRLAVTSKCLELALLVTLGDAVLVGPSIVEPIMNSRGEYWCGGQGIEYSTSQPVSVSFNKEAWLVLNEP